ncbi:LLM class flavin-dependent oxidoreductase [Pimelobacter simplex]|uniref:LLM class flavin-dependent oxidoreductase n=1 Tax=Nocardioides simplex TaxID=2045 RepID=UPI0038027059
MSHPAPRFLVPLATRDERSWPGFDIAEQRAQALRAAELGGFAGVVAADDLGGDEASVVAYDALRASRWLEVVQELPISRGNPVYAAKQAASAQRFFDGRLGWQLVVDEPGPSQTTPPARTRAERYARATEFLTVARGVWHDTEFTFEGRYHQVVGGGFREALADLPFPRLHLSGSSDEALALSARYADVHLFDDLDTALAHGPALRAAAGDRPLEIGVALRVVAREHRPEVPRTIDPRTALVGTYDELAERLAELVAAGITTYLLDAHPRIEETYRIAEHLLPRVRDLTPAGGAR